jgi:DNA-binding transcriptional ArsR family regulator
LGALAQRSRLAIFKLLVEAGPDGLPAGLIGERLDLPPATLSFHLAHLARAGLLRQQQAGRFVIYSTNFETMNELVDYLTENCCAGTGCTTSASKAVKCGPSVPTRRRSSAKAGSAGRKAKRIDRSVSPIR